MKRQILLVALWCSPLFALPQVVYQDLTNTGIYDFMDELANLRIIDVTSVVKPYSRIFIAEKLKEALAVKEKLNKRQKKELDFYLRDFNLELKSDLSYFKKKDKGMFKKKEHVGIPLSPLSFIYKDSLFTFSLRPIYGVYAYVPEDYKTNKYIYHNWGGLEIFGTIGKHVGFYTSLRDNHESELLVDRGYLTTDEGAAWKDHGDYSEVRGGVTFAWNWGSVLLAKDHFQWGDNYHGSNILSGRTPSFPFLQLSMKPVRWFSFQFVTAMLISEVVDSSRRYEVPGGYRDYYFNKFLSAAMVTFTPWRGLDLSLGNSVVSCSQSYNPAYLSPFLFYLDPPSSGDSAQKASHGKNSQLFFNISSRQIRHLHLYASVFIDDLGTTKFNDTTYTSISWKAGFRFSNLFNQNMTLTAEYTRTSPKTYSSPVSTQTFESSRYCMGNYLRDNSHEIYATLGYRPVRGLLFNVTYNRAEHGGRFDKKTLNTVSWTYDAWKLDVSYEFINNAYFTIGYQYLNITGDESLSPPVFMGSQSIISGGVNIGF